MPNELQHYMMWTFVNEAKLPDDVEDLLVPGERAICAYSTIRDVAIFTDKRLIVRDAQGIRWKCTRFPINPLTCIRQKTPDTLT